MRVKSQSPIIASTRILFFVVCLFIFVGCSPSMVIGSMINGMRTGLKTDRSVKLDYSPYTYHDASADAEFFNDLSDNTAIGYKSDFIADLESYKIHFDNSDSARFSIEVVKVSYRERTEEECKTNEEDEEFCFTLNRLSIKMEMKVTDHLNQTEKVIKTGVYESSRIRKVLIGKALTEISWGLNVDIMMGRLLKKSAGKAAKFIRKSR